MALAVPKKKKIIRIVIVIASLVSSLLDGNVSDSAEEQCLRLCGHAETLMDSWDENEGSWTFAQVTLWNLIEQIHNAHSPEALEVPDQSDYQQWQGQLTDAIAAVS
jgi:hypothetical protein